MQLLLVGRSETGLRSLEAAFAPGAGAVAAGEALLAAGDPEPPPPLNGAGSQIIRLVSDDGVEARLVGARLLDARPDRYALLCAVDTEHGEDGVAWTHWLSCRGGRAARVDEQAPARDPAAFGDWFFEQFGLDAPSAFTSTPAPNRGAGPEASPPRPVQEATLPRSAAPGFRARAKARILERMWLIRHGRAAVEELRASLGFDAAWYLAAYPDVAEAGLDPALHYLGAGAAEGRAPRPGHLAPAAGAGAREGGR